MASQESEARAALQDAQEFYLNRAARSWVVPYMKDRRLTQAAGAFGVGHAPSGWQTTVNHLRSIGHRDDALVDAGLAFRSERTGNLLDCLRNRLTVPLRDEDGRVIGFTGRTSPDTEDSEPKYFNTRTTELFHKNRVLFGLADQTGAFKAGARPIIVEGVMDAMAVHQTATEAALDVRAVAPLGTALTQAHVAALGKHIGFSREVITAFDPDAAGAAAETKAWAMLRDLGNPARALDLPSGSDPADLVAHGDSTKLVDLIAEAEPLWDRVITRELRDFGTNHDPGKRMNYALNLVNEHVDHVQAEDRTALITRIATELRVEHTPITFAAVERLVYGSEGSRTNSPADDEEASSAMRLRTAGFGTTTHARKNPTLRATSQSAGQERSEPGRDPGR